MTEKIPRLLAYLTKNYSELKLRLAAHLKSLDVAEEALQEVFFKLKSHAQQGEEIQNPDAYIFKIALNAAHDLRRSELRYIVKKENVAQHAATSWSIENFGIETLHQADKLRAAINALPPRQRQVLIAVRIYGMGRDEIAKQLGLSKTTIQNELRAALTAIAKACLIEAPNDR